MLKRRLLLSAATLGAAAVIGFLAGEIHHPAAASPPPTSSLAAVLTNAQTASPSDTQMATPALPASIDVSADALSNMNLHVAKATFAPLVRTVQVTGVVGF